MLNTANFEFTDQNGAFRLHSPTDVNERYFPLCNEAGLMASVTPMLNGDIKTDQHHFLMPPVTIEDFYNSRSARNFWFYIHGKGAWSAAGNSARQISQGYEEAENAGAVTGTGGAANAGVMARAAGAANAEYAADTVCCAGVVSSAGNERTIEAGPLWHKLIYGDKLMGLVSEILSFVPVDTEKVEIMSVMLTNEGKEEIRITPTSAIPLYGRSAENIRDHRHVTSLVNRLERLDCGLLMKPLILFDEHGHRYNDVNYYVLGVEANGCPPVGTIPAAHSFAGRSGSYDWPEAVVKNLDTAMFDEENLDGKEYIGALRFKELILKPGEKAEWIILAGVCTGREEAETVFSRYNTADKVAKALEKNRDHWSSFANNTSFTARINCTRDSSGTNCTRDSSGTNCTRDSSGTGDFSNWMKWVALQPVLRKIYGCSFLPHHDYGKGGRGWRDLWQDCLSLILQDPGSVRGILFNNFGGVRADGTNATIIGVKAGEFIADRNNIPRVWMDHGSWPYLTTKLYLDYSGDFGFLLEKQAYFRDSLIMRASGRDEHWRPEQGQFLQTEDGKPYAGTILEHILVQHLTSFFNTGEHNIIRLEGGDWNDTLDMARERGESAAFSSLYAGNLISLSKLIILLESKLKIKKLELFEELCLLLDTLTGEAEYGNTEYKRSLLDSYMQTVSGRITGRKASLKASDVSHDLRKKGEWMSEWISRKEWVETKDGGGFFNGYYNNDGNRVDGEFEEEIRMNLTAQVFTAMSGLASGEQVKKAYDSCRRYLKDTGTGGYRLNTDLGGNRLNFGRGFAFAYGEKENGSVFCHMVVMYINALYKRGFAKEAFEVFKSLYLLSADTQKNGIYPGIPEYFTPEGKGMYHYLTGSASWLMLTVLNEMFGVRGENGDLLIQPRLMAEQFGRDGTASACTRFKGLAVEVSYINKAFADYPDYFISGAILNGRDIVEWIHEEGYVKIPETFFTEACAEKILLEITLGI